MSIYNRKKKPKLLDSHLEYIDPVDCHSLVGYTIGTTEYGGFRASVDVGSCDRRINWDFDTSNENDYERSCDKIENAILALKQFRDAYFIHGRNWLDSKKRKKKRCTV